MVALTRRRRVRDIAAARAEEESEARVRDAFTAGVGAALARAAVVADRIPNVNGRPDAAGAVAMTWAEYRRMMRPENLADVAPLVGLLPLAESVSTRWLSS